MFEFDSEKTYPKETESRVLIRFQDCDPLRHLNNAKYFDYFFNAREDQVPKLYGVEMMDFIKKYQAAWVIYNHNISYVKPAMVGEWVRIKSRIIWNNHNTVILEYFMTDDTETQLKTLLWSTMRYVTLAEGKSTDHQGAVNDFLKATSINLDIEGLNVKDRVKSLSQALKK
ncbi:acyl-CoA thioesterase [Algoriphagus halophytocola]|uniref:Acyl-CoA thioesterase n=1 Tax=Algoriphagus halophytocola TaxID=2991499 RepID=A0ABY6MJH0_9BACT|nr:MULTISPECIES: acyl-CoA thioesterase [unclassified Algoriphagus]UZD23099.1 acyl-CoA thioesterase [Algoriphagus sp. TR-M5]WBL44391.1 acyl-CoA thioesterase [Algoriphagus sp. TR-M9]